MVGPAPLFDLLTDAGFESVELGGLDREGLLISVAREIADLLNTRAPRGDFAPEPVGAPDYGAPDFSEITIGDPAARTALEGALQRVIAAFEPRLANPRVHAEPLTGEGRIRFLAAWNAHAARLSQNATLRALSAWVGPLPSSGEPGALIIEITGDLRHADGGVERVSFPLIGAATR